MYRAHCSFKEKKNGKRKGDKPLKCQKETEQRQQ